MLFGILDGKVRAALFALLSVGLGAWAYVRMPNFSVPAGALDGGFLAALWLVGLGTIAGLLASWLGRLVLPDNPQIAMGLFEMRAFVALAILSVITYVTLCASQHLVPKTGADEATKASLGSVEQAVTAVIAAIGAAIAGDQSRNAVATLAKAEFETAYKKFGVDPDKPTGAEKEVRHAAFSDPYVPEVTKWKNGNKPTGASGWDFEGRWARVKAIAANL